MTIEAVETLSMQVQDISELLDASTQSKKVLNRPTFKKILQNMCYLFFKVWLLEDIAAETIAIILSCYN